MFPFSNSWKKNTFRKVIIMIKIMIHLKEQNIPNFNPYLTLKIKSSNLGKILDI